jgi:hypothetical protein
MQFFIVTRDLYDRERFSTKLFLIPKESSCLPQHDDMC